MTMRKRLSFAAMTALFMMSAAVGAQAEVITTETRLVHTPVPGPTVVDFRAFDTNHDGTLSMQEVGEYLFYTFDKDGNQLIDNKEFDHPMVLTFAPMERQTVQKFDFNNDGIVDESTVTQQSFLQQTGLSRFSEGKNGLSASDFIKKPMKQVDRDLSGQIDIKEWKEAYFALLKPLPQNDTFRYND